MNRGQGQIFEKAKWAERWAFPSGRGRPSYSIRPARLCDVLAAGLVARALFCSGAPGFLFHKEDTVGALLLFLLSHLSESPAGDTCCSRSMVFSIVVFGCIVNEGYTNRQDEKEEHCIFNRNHNACNYGITVGVLAFLSCLLYLALDVYFPQISSVKDRKKAVLSDIGVSGLWAFLWFVGFCFLANQWQVSKHEDNPLNEGADAARAAITFSFFSIFTWEPPGPFRLSDFSFEMKRQNKTRQDTSKVSLPVDVQAMAFLQKAMPGAARHLLQTQWCRALKTSSVQLNRCLCGSAKSALLGQSLFIFNAKGAGSLTVLAFQRFRDISFQEEYNTLFPSSPPLLP
ncbi:synaptogyrin-1 isoform X2 [Alligator sinensis]|uniref:Synaptogyrin-1 isoform X2 n=1 Tax=Alligator sinensis TaxID=38654 RepID=A0A3Q0H669_ALLSI|nr:synaptogyrin-1 isoform X2 [Alligator sinensis]